MTWRPIPFSAKLFTNVKESVLTRTSAAVENCFINEADGFTRFPGLRAFSTLVGSAPTYLSEWEGDLIAVTSGQTFRIDSNGVATNVTQAVVSGGRRVVFTKTEFEMVMAAGGPIVRLTKQKTDLVSSQAPFATHVDFIDGYLLANEVGTGLFFVSEVDDATLWDPLDVFAASGTPDNVTAIQVSPYREVIIAGPNSMEQFERLPSGSSPFFRRWAVGSGVLAPYTLVTADNGTWFVNDDYEFARASGQSAQSLSDDIGRSLEGCTDWTDAWAQKMHLLGQKFIILQMPHANNVYGTKGITALFDYRRQRWSNLYGWDAAKSLPSRWPGWSFQKIWGRNFVGGDGVVLELHEDAFQNAGAVHRMYGRTGHFDQFGPSRIDRMRLRVKNIAWTSGTAPIIRVRATRDNHRSTRWVERALPRIGEEGMDVTFSAMGDASRTWQFEWMITDACEAEVVGMQADVTGLER